MRQTLLVEGHLGGRSLDDRLRARAIVERGGLIGRLPWQAADAVEEVIDLSVEELRGLKRTLVPDDELKRAKDHLKGSLMLSLENTASRMSHLARQEIYFDRHFSLDETLAGVQRVTAADIQRVARDLLSNGSLAVTVLGPKTPDLPQARLDLG